MTQRLMMAATILALTVLFTTAARAGDETKPIGGFAVGPQMNEIVPGRFIVDPPTIENLGFRWYVEGDSNRNASVTVEFRRQGQSQWKEALPMLRVHHEVVNQVYGPYRVGNLFASSVLFLEPTTTYEIRFTMYDPDGGTPAESRFVTATTRAEPQAFSQGRTMMISTGKELAAAFRRARPGDVILLAPGVYEGPFEPAKGPTSPSFSIISKSRAERVYPRCSRRWI